ncbi:MAG: hypothetical protein IT429_03480 [Gemmataceae bacterium]|nr:hypothetical protein [Gemmataceae bacterium]
MNRRLLLLVNSPALLLGLVLIGTCAVSLWAIHSLQANLLRSIHRHDAGLRAAHDMEVAVRQLQFDSLLQLLQPTAKHQESIRVDHQLFDTALQRVSTLHPPGQRPLLDQIETGYRRYREELNDVTERPPGPDGVLRWLEQHPVQHVVGPCRQLLDANEERMARALTESTASADWIQLALFVLGGIGPLGGLICGYSIHRVLGRSIARLRVRVEDVHSHVAPEVSVIDLQVGEGLDSLHTHLNFLVERVRSLVERLQAQQREIIRSEQLAMVGRLASGIAHEIRNPLTTLKWLVEGAARAYPDEPLTSDDLHVMHTEIERVEGAVQGMLDFARPPRPHPAACDLRELVRQVVELTRARRRQLGVTCGLELPPEPVVARVDPGQFKSVLVNLLLNALDAMPQGGNLQLRVRCCSAAGIRVVVEDTGGGISPEILERLFVPFASTKANGTGLGLSVARRIIEDHGGQLSAENRAEGGARFVVELPA